MASHGAAIQRPSASPPLPSPQPKELKKNHKLTFQITIPLSIPFTPESAATRIIRNLGMFGLYYFEFIWIVLFIALIPQRKVSLIVMTASKEAAIVYILLVRAVPATLVLVHKILDKRIVLSLLALGTVIALVATDSGLHLLVTLAATVPVILAHAGLWSGWGQVDDALENDNVHDYAPLV